MDGLRRRALGFGRVQWGGRAMQMLPPSFERTRSTAEMALAHMAWAGVDRAFAVQGNHYGPCNGYVARMAAAHPGTANHKPPRPRINMMENTPIHGLRGSPASAIAPRTGARTAAQSCAALVAKAQSDWASAGSLMKPFTK